ncbi:MAG: hypothetical protein C4527_16140 [Candidatus Omnitrophota bacterium]|jgi:hypothetical protein|nr:MAG: hypothetical protein C4527_16140 [Candidatus Omnitrophota bacterium]
MNSIRRIRSISFCLILSFSWCASASAENVYSTYTSLSTILRELQSEFSEFVRLSSLAVSAEGREVWLLEIGAGSEEERLARPAMLVVAGVEGNHLAGTETALAFVKQLCRTGNPSEDKLALLKTTTIYVIPRLNPDGAERYFHKPQMEFVTNTAPYDDDRDGLTDEDGPDDRNGDGIISWMRIEDAIGTWIEHPDDMRILIEADPAKGERGRWLLQVEGRDNDGDEKINEDGLGGVNFNNNFPFAYPWFEPQAGIYQMSEKETRGLAEFIVSHPHIGVVFTLESQGNLLKKPETDKGSNRRDPQTKIREEDGNYYEQLGKDYRERMQITKEIKTDSVPGSFSDWIYFHRGRLALSAPVWNPEIALALKKKEGQPEKKEESTEKEENGEVEKNEKSEQQSDKKKDDERGKTDRDYLAWLDTNAPGAFIPWSRIEHPDYPGQIVEVGGFAAYAKVLPPATLLNRLTENQALFLIQLANKLPRIAIRDLSVKHLGEGVYDLRVLVGNDGYLPTVLAHGERTREVLPTRIEIDLPGEAFLAGGKRTMLGPIAAGEVKEQRYIVKAEKEATATVRIISALAGCVERTIKFSEN